MDKLLFDQSQISNIIQKQKKIRNKIIISSISFVILFCIVSIFFVKENKTIYILSSIILIALYSFYLFSLLTIKLPKLKSYQQLISKVVNEKSETKVLEVKKILNYLITRDNLEFHEITFYLDDTHKQELSLYLEKSLTNSFQENKKYQVNISSKYICSYTEVN